jgi:hypothetical protein
MQVEVHAPNEFAGDLMRNYEARMRRKAEPASR